MELAPGQKVDLSFRISADLTSFTGRDGRRIVEPGEFVIEFGRSAGEIEWEQSVRLSGRTRVVDHTRRLIAEVEVG